MEDYIFCGNCGAKVDASLNFCPKCGSKIIRAQENDGQNTAFATQEAKESNAENNSETENEEIKTTAPVKPGKSVNKYAVVGIIAVIVIIAGFFAGKNTQTKKLSTPAEAKEEVRVKETVTHEETAEFDTDSVQVPEVVGSDIESAKQILTSMGLVPTVTEDYSNMYAKGLVDSVTPEVGEYIKKGTAVSLIVSKGYSCITADDVKGNCCIIDGHIDFDSWRINSVSISKGTLEIEMTYDNLRYGLASSMYFVDTYNHVNISLNDNEAEVVGKYEVLSGFINEMSFDDNIADTQTIKITADISKLDGCDNPLKISIRTDIMNSCIFNKNNWSDWRDYAKTIHITLSPGSWTNA